MLKGRTAMRNVWIKQRQPVVISTPRYVVVFVILFHIAVTTIALYRLDSQLTSIQEAINTCNYSSTKLWL